MTDSSRRPVIMWFTSDLRLSDNAALVAAARSRQPVLTCFVLDRSLRQSAPGAASRWWLHQSLADLAREIAQRGGALLLLRGPASEALSRLVEQTGATQVFAARSHSPDMAASQADLTRKLARRNAGLALSAGQLLFAPENIFTRNGEPFRVYTPFSKACLAAPDPGDPLPVPRRLQLVDPGIEACDLAAWRLLPRAPNWARDFEACWRPGESGARAELERFIDGPICDYARLRDRPDVPGTSRLSPHLHFGEISARQVWRATLLEMQKTPGIRAGAESFLREILWREFSHHLLWHWPDLCERPFKPDFAAFPWRDDEAGLEAWQRGQTGYPIVDAGMRELWATGWMHNRVRMIAASFLVKDLMVPWQRGAAWFWDTLVDADLANNSASWQWVAGSGADAAPYFRIFNPTTQSRKFDPNAAYIRRWIPELRGLAAEHVHEPAAAPRDVLARAGIRLEDDYPRPIVDHSNARTAALAAYQRLKKPS